MPSTLLDPGFGQTFVYSCADHTQRNLIPTNRRHEGMLAYTSVDQSYWRLMPLPWSGTDSDWVQLS